MAKQKAIMFADFENFFYALKNNHHYEAFQGLHLLKIINHLKTSCNLDILHSAAYADWGRLPHGFQGHCVQAGCIPVYVSAYNYVTQAPKKDQADKHILLDCVEWLYRRENAFDTLILLTGDADFMPVADKFMAYGKNVIVCSVRVASNVELFQNVTQAFYVDDILEQVLQDAKYDYQREQLRLSQIQETTKAKVIPITESVGSARQIHKKDDERARIRNIVDTVHRLEQTMPFLSLTYFRDKILPQFLLENGDGYEERKRLLDTMVASGYFVIAQVANPRNPQYKTSTIRLNRSNTILWQWYPELASVTQELEKTYIGKRMA